MVTPPWAEAIDLGASVLCRVTYDTKWQRGVDAYRWGTVSMRQDHGVRVDFLGHESAVVAWPNVLLAFPRLDAREAGLAELMRGLLTREDKPTVPEVLPLIHAYRALPGNSVGGSLHIVLDDGNLEDSHLEFCLNWAVKENDALGALLARLLLRCSMTQRRKVYRLG